MGHVLRGQRLKLKCYCLFYYSFINILEPCAQKNSSVNCKYITPKSYAL